MNFDEELRKLDEQHTSGAITDEEYLRAVDNLVKPPLRDRLFLGVFLSFFSLFFSRSSGAWGFFALVILLFVTGYQLVPGWEWVKLDWPAAVYFAVVGVAGAVAGFLGGQRRAVASVCGAIVAIVSLWAISLAHQWLPQFLPNWISRWTGVAALAVGLIPGVLLYAICDSLLPPLPDDDPSHAGSVGRCPNPACRSHRGWDGTVCKYCGTRTEPGATPDGGS